MNTRTGRHAARACTAAVAVLGAALLAGGRRIDPITCSVTSVSVAKVIPVSSDTEPSTILNIEVEPVGPRSALFLAEPAKVTSVTDAAGKELLKQQREGILMMTPGKSRRERLVEKIRRAVRPTPYPQPTQQTGFRLEAFPSTIKSLKGSVQVLTGEEVVVPLEMTEGQDPVEVSPGVTFVVTKIADRSPAAVKELQPNATQRVEFEIHIRKDQAGDGSEAGDEPVVVGISQRKNGKEIASHMYDQLHEKAQGEEYVIKSPPPLTLTDGTGATINWELHLIRNIHRTTVGFECSDLVVLPAR
jgi:hypothetical protein